MHMKKYQMLMPMCAGQSEEYAMVRLWGVDTEPSTMME